MLGVCSHFFGTHFILRHMQVQFVTEQGRNPFKNAIIAAALDERRMVRLSQCFISFQVDGWNAFMNIAWKACAECTRDHRGRWCIEHMPIAVRLEDGRTFSTFIWYDVEAKGLRYVSLH